MATAGLALVLLPIIAGIVLSLLKILWRGY
jgi:hypothetical protein